MVDFCSTYITRIIEKNFKIKQKDSQFEENQKEINSDNKID